jgi:sec-independent protein translocase protein TatA
MINLPEIIIILVIVMIVFGLGKLGNVGAHLESAKKGFREGLEGEEPDETSEPEETTGGRDVIDITPHDEEDRDWNPKPGTRRDPVEDAEIEASDPAR